MSILAAGVLLAILSGLMNGSFTLPMRFLGRWDWEHVWSLFIAISCLLLPNAILAFEAPQSWGILATAPVSSLEIAALTGFAWGFGSLMFGQSVSAIGISLANTLVLAISSALGSLLPLILLAHDKLFARTGLMVLSGVAVQVLGILFCGLAGHAREKAAGVEADRGGLVGKARPMGVALLLATGSGILSAVFNIGFALAQPIADHGRAAGLSSFDSTNLIWWVMLGSGSVANLLFCGFLFIRNHNFTKFFQPGAARLLTLSSVMALLWGGSIFVYGAAAPRLGSLGVAIGWPLSLATGLLLANALGMGLGEWRQAPVKARRQMNLGIAILLVAILLLSRAGN